MQKMYFLIVNFIFVAAIFSQTIQENTYFGQTPPGKTPEIFAPGVISISTRNDFYVTFSADNSEMFFGNSGQLKHSIKENGEWQPLGDADKFQGYEVRFATGGGILYLYQNLKLSYSLKSDEDWSDPIKIDVINTSLTPQFPSVTRDSVLFFKNADPSHNLVYYTRFDGTQHEIPQPLPYPINFNSKFNPNDVCISPTGDYILMMKEGSGIWHVSFKKSETHWTYPRSLRVYTNGIPHFGLNAIVTPDGKYLFACNWTQSNIDIYWLSAEIIEDVRNSNFAPYVRNEIPDTTIYVGQSYYFPIPDSTFFDDDSDSLTYSVSKGSAAWLNFDAENRILSGTPTAVGNVTVRVKATDSKGEKVQDSFKINITENPTRVAEPPEKSLNFNLYQNFPNPFNPETTIKFTLFNSSNVQLTIYNLQGERIRTFLNSLQSAGNYQIIWEAKDDTGIPVSSGMYFFELRTNGGFLRKKMMLLR